MLAPSRLILAATLMIGPAGTSFAHAWLQSSIPAADSTVTRVPDQVSITFTSAIEPRFSTITVTGDNAQRVDDARPRAAEGDTTHLSVGLRGLPPGTYTVAWHATSVDTHQTDGTYRFTVADTNATGIGLEHVWARPTPAVTTPGVTYFTVVSNGTPDKLLSVSTPIAASAELHETVDDKGIMKMRPVASVELVPGQPVTFKPGGYHVMLMGLKSPLKSGDSFPLTLTFEHAQPITVTAKVESPATTGMGGGSMGGMPGMSGK
jgi:copper(I)-binding protein